MPMPQDAKTTVMPVQAAAGGPATSGISRPSVCSGLLYTMLRHGLGHSHSEACARLEQALARPGSTR